ncbi:arginase family-domain-containing protein [Amylocarpus encephaloides]|uniref:Arginase family-domain-containing protein n=1 Tax=Amylocarpus encephaloides TaxID=45428 RepID=A0A9P7Y9I9_9HELO|nr:arginase family-domain-containing protein [Amylocarpus encephaloides]
MFPQLFVLLSLAEIAFATQLVDKDTQKPLSEAEAFSNFISKSIFGRRNFNLRQSHVPETVPPSFFAYAGFDNGGFGYNGIATFAHLPYTICTKSESDKTFDIGIVGHPFDLGVSYRPGARFGPNGARQGARRLSPVAGWDLGHNGVNPFRDWASVVDCGDISNAPFDKMEAIHELEAGMKSINSRTPKNMSVSEAVRLITIGGDHTITLPILRALHATWGPVAVLHFDSHLDTWDPKQLGGGVTKYAEVNHGTMLHIAHEEGLLSNNSNMHLGSRCGLLDEHYDLNNDLRCGFGMIRAREIDKLGIDKIVQKVVDRVGDKYVYLSVDIDVLDPAFAPATGTIEPGGWTTRELLTIIQGLSSAGLKIVGSDVVEFTPIYDNAAETTGIAVGDIVYEILHWMVQVPVKKPS